MMISRVVTGQEVDDGPAKILLEAATLDLPGAPEGMIVVDLSLEPVAVDRGGEAILSELSETPFAGASSFQLPPELRECLRAGLPAAQTSTTLRVSSTESQYSCRIFVMTPQNGAVSQPLLAIHMKREKSVGEAVRRVGRAYHLTAREQEAVVGIAMGLTSRQVADRMNISPNTVNAFLRLIMVKMGVTTRAGVVGKLLNGKATPLPVESKPPHQATSAKGRETPRVFRATS
jgi:DNA-binding CsgD family transcriptional regulator